MQFRTYRADKGLTLKQCADVLGFTEATVQRHETGVRQVDITTAEKYRIFTGGAVTFADWLSLRRKSAPKKPAKQRISVEDSEVAA